MRTILTWLGAALALLSGPVAEARAEIRSMDLITIRSVLEGDWLRLKLEILGLKLSYPAYRIELGLNDENQVVFTFWTSRGLAEHLEEVGRGEAESILSYHARGIGVKLSALISTQFPELWPSFNARDDFKGFFMVPGTSWDDEPEELGRWGGDRLTWAP
jgi:hypothetical protein